MGVRGGGGVGTGIHYPKFMEGIMSGSLMSHEVIYRKRFVSKIYLYMYLLKYKIICFLG